MITAVAAVTTDIPLSLYVHLPWCIRKCPYCDFNSHEATGALRYREYIDALLRDLATHFDDIGGRAITSIFIGGGTPSLFPGDEIAYLIESLNAATIFSDAIEITLEANPGAADYARFRDYARAGINRLSIGIQSFRNDQLLALGRVHDATEARSAINAARDAGFDNFNIDLMHGLPGNDLEGCLFDLETAIEFEPKHLSWYQLTMEPGTVFARKPPRLPDDDEIAAEFDAGKRILTDLGFAHYEVSAYARDGALSRHNLNYWTFGDYIGIGAGAHGKVTRNSGIFRTEKRRSPAAYLNHAGTPYCTTYRGPLSDSDLVTEYFLNSLRLSGGCPRTLFEARTGIEISAVQNTIDTACARGWLHVEQESIRPTALGFRFLNDLQLLFLDAEIKR